MASAISRATGIVRSVSGLLREFHHLFKPHVGKEDKRRRLEETGYTKRHLKVIHPSEVGKADQDHHDYPGDLDQGHVDGNPAVSLIPAMRMPERIRMIATADGRSGRPTRSEK